MRLSQPALEGCEDVSPLPQPGFPRPTSLNFELFQNASEDLSLSTEHTDQRAHIASRSQGQSRRQSFDHRD